MNALEGAATIDEARRILARALEQAGKESPTLDSRILIGHALGLDQTALLSDGNRRLTIEQRKAIAGLAERRMSGEPVARILGVREFWGLPFALSKATLVPRPETETLVEAALEASGDRRGETLRIVDLGTGTGALLLALLHEFKNASGIGTDLDESALATAAENARTLGLAERAQFIRTDFGAGLRPPFDLVVSNPPYIPARDIAALAVEVREHDPRLALDGGEDGLEAYRAIARQLPSLLASDGFAVLEIGIAQWKAVTAIIESAGLRVTMIRPDLAGIPRAMVVQNASDA